MVHILTEEEKEVLNRMTTNYRRAVKDLGKAGADRLLAKGEDFYSPVPKEALGMPAPPCIMTNSNDEMKAALQGFVDEVGPLNVENEIRVLDGITAEQVVGGSSLARRLHPTVEKYGAAKLLAIVRDMKPSPNAGPNANPKSGTGWE